MNSLFVFFVPVILAGLAATWYVFQIFLHTGLYNDLLFYYESFVFCNDMDAIGCAAWVVSISGKFELGMVLVYKLMHYLGINSDKAFTGIIFFMINLLSLLFARVLYLKNSYKPLTSVNFALLFIFCLFNYFYFTTTTYFVRQIFAILLFFIGVVTPISALKYFLFVFSISFHYSAIVLISAYVVFYALKVYKFLNSIVNLIALSIVLSLCSILLQDNFAFLTINATLDPYTGGSDLSSALHTLQQYILALVILVSLHAKKLKVCQDSKILNSMMIFFCIFAIFNFLNVHASYRAFIPVAIYCSLLPLTHYQYFKFSIVLPSAYFFLLLLNLRLGVLYLTGIYTPS